MKVICCTVIALCLTFALSAETPAPVRVAGGSVQGVLEDDLTVYKGIPFAAPPVGDLRWRAPQPVAKWPGVLNADGKGETSVADIGIFQVQNGEFVQLYTGSVVDGDVVLTPYEAPAAEMPTEATMEAAVEPTEEMMATEAATEAAPMAEMTPEATAAS